MTTANGRLLAERNLARDQAASAAGDLEQAQARVKQLEAFGLTSVRDLKKLLDKGPEGGPGGRDAYSYDHTPDYWIRVLVTKWEAALAEGATDAITN